MTCDGAEVARHRRSLAKHRTITDPAHVASAHAMRAEAQQPTTPTIDDDVEVRDLADLRPGARGRVMATRHREARDDLAYLCRALKAPSLAAVVERLAERARTESWTHEEFLAACLEREVAARQDHGGEGRIRAARFPARKTLEDFDFDHQRSLKRDVIAHLGTLDFVDANATTSCSSDRPAPARPTSRSASRIRACQAGHRVAFATAAEWVARLGDAHAQGRLHDELRRLGRIPLLVIDEVGYIPFEAEAANLFFQLVSAPATNAPASSSPATNPSAAGAKSSATPPSPPP